MKGIEAAIRRKGFRRLAGVDEAGRGALAGPVVAAAVILRDGRPIPGVTDSKRLSQKRRELLYKRIAEEALAVGVGIVDRIMATYHQRYPTYGFDQHKGYGTAAHLRFIAEHGASPIHRKTFSPLRHMSLPLATPGR
jgi:ribonuclease HII